MRKSDDQDLRSMLEMLEKELLMLVDYKKHINNASNEDVKKLLNDNEKDAEKHAALLTKMIDKLYLK